MNGLPDKVLLYSNKDEFGRLVFRVEDQEGKIYKWQRCKADTAEWMTIPNRKECSMTTHINTELMTGDKYRCLVYEGDILKSYSSTYTIRKNIRMNDPFASVKKIARTDGISKNDFEELISEILKWNGIEIKQYIRYHCDYKLVNKGSRRNPVYMLQCKCVEEKSEDARSFRVVISNGIFTRASIRKAQMEYVVLWDRFCLDEMMIHAEEAEKHATFLRKNQGRKKQIGNKAIGERAIADNQFMTPDFFAGCVTESELKDRMHTLLQMYHPDHGGSEDLTKMIIQQYEARIK